MSSSERTNPLWYLLGLVVVGMVAWWLVKMIFTFVIVGAIVVGGAMYLTRRGRGAVRGGRRGRIGH